MPGTALLAAGGGCRGVLQAGAMVAFKELNFDYDCLFGSSVGSLNGMLLHQGEENKLYDLWMNLKQSDVYNSNPISFLNAFGRKASLYDSKPLSDLIDKYINISRLRSNPRKFSINTTDINNRQPLTLELKDLADNEIASFIKGSASPPIFFPPVKFRNSSLIDCGVSNNFGIISALNSGCETLILISPTKPSLKAINNVMDMLNAVLVTSTNNYLEREIKSVEKINNIIDQINIVLEPDHRKIKLITIIPDIAFDMSLLDFTYQKFSKEFLWDYGYKLAKKVLSSI